MQKLTLKPIGQWPDGLPRYLPRSTDEHHDPGWMLKMRHAMDVILHQSVAEKWSHEKQWAAICLITSDIHNEYGIYKHKQYIASPEPRAMEGEKPEHYAERYQQWKREMRERERAVNSHNQHVDKMLAAFATAQDRWDAIEEREAMQNEEAP